jgi:Raf kinase inhibitor-like YbhB/YbcL family protein
MAKETFMSCRHNRALTTTSVARIAGFLALFASPGCSRPDALPVEDRSRLTIQLHSSAFADGAMIPKTFTCDGHDRSPPLEWSGVPSSARALALICDDPDAPAGTWSHWVVFNLPPQVTALKEGVPPEQTLPAAVTGGSQPAGGDFSQARQGKNDFGKTGYGGPCPPRGTHRYYFRLYALDKTLELDSTARRSDVLKAVQGHIVAEGRLVGKYERAR